MTIELIVSQNEAFRAVTLVSAFCVDANVRAVVYFQALIHIVTSFIVRSKHKPCLTGAAMRTDKIYADVGAVSIIFHTLVYVSARKAILV